MDEFNHLTDLLYEILIMEHRGSIYRVARRAGMAYRTVNEYCSDHRKTPPVGVLKAAFLETRDPRLKALLEPEGYVLAHAGEPARPSGGFEQEVGDVHLAAAELHRRVREALEDGRIDKAENLSIRRAIEDARRELCDVEALLG